jgi:hypothetical protein
MDLLELGGSRVAEQRGGATELRPLMERRHTMPTEDHSSDRSDQGVPQGVDLSLDELAKELATGTLSRGKALRLMGAALVGGALASIPGTAWAARCPSPRIRCRGQCCPTGVTTCVGTGRNKTCGPCPTGTTLCAGNCQSTVCPEGEFFDPDSCLCDLLCDPPCPAGVDCRITADGTGRICICASGGCTNDCLNCTSRGFTCVIDSGCAAFGGFRCVIPC